MNTVSVRATLPFGRVAEALKRAVAEEKMALDPIFKAIVDRGVAGL